MKRLNSLQTNAQVLEQIRRSRGRIAQNNLPEMRRFTERAGVNVSSFKSNSSILEIGVNFVLFLLLFVKVALAITAK